MKLLKHANGCLHCFDTETSRPSFQTRMCVSHESAFGAHVTIFLSQAPSDFSFSHW